jgi:hypothetical protein
MCKANTPQHIDSHNISIVITSRNFTQAWTQGIDLKYQAQFSVINSSTNFNSELYTISFSLNIMTDLQGCLFWYELNYTAHFFQPQYNTAHAFCMLVTKATHTHAEYLIFNAFPQLQCLRGTASVLSIYLSSLLSSLFFRSLTQHILTISSSYQRFGCG